MAANSYAVAVADTELRQFVDSSFGIHGELVNKIIVGLGFIFLRAVFGCGYNGHFGIVEHGIALRDIIDG